MTIFNPIFVFILARFCEIGGGYLFWLWLREGNHFSYGVFGGLILATYGVIATLHPANFGRVSATYGGIFIVMSIL